MADSPQARLHALDVEQESFPGWHWLATALGPAAVAVATIAIAKVERPGVLALLLLVAIGPWAVEAVRRSPFQGPTWWVPVGAIGAVQLAAEPLGAYDADGHHQASLLILAYAVGETAAIRARWEVFAMTAASVVIAAVPTFTQDQYDSGHIWTAAMFIGLFCGLLIRRLIFAVTDLKEAQAALEAEATARERQRIAREVHDVIAHSLTVTMLHVTAARMAVGRGDPAAATEALEEAERLGRRSLADIRSTVGLLRADDGGGATAAALPLAGDIAELIDGYRAAGVGVDADLDPHLADLPAPVGLAVHRIVQEALANVVKHAPGATARVTVRNGDAVEIVVTDDGEPSSTPGTNGHGVLGMRERAESLGGDFSAGPTPTGWTVRATIPS